MPKEHVVTTAVVAALTYSLIARYATGLALFHVTLIAALGAFCFRVLAVKEHWPQIVFAAPPLLKKVGGSR